MKAIGLVLSIAGIFLLYIGFTGLELKDVIPDE